MPDTPTHYLDSSALVKRYATEAGSAVVASLFADATAVRVCASHVALVEVTSALRRKVLGKHLSEPLAERASRAATADFHSASMDRLLVTPAVLELARDLAWKHGLRAYDAVHLATAVLSSAVRLEALLEPMVFVASDNRLLRAAESEGLPTLDPEKP